MAISYSISNTTNYTPVGIGIINSDTQFPAIYGNADFGYTVTFSETLGYPITNVAVLSNPTYVTALGVKLSVNSIRIEKNPLSDLYSTEKYIFAEFDENFVKTTEEYSSSEAEQSTANASLFKWQTPTQESVVGTFNIRFTYTNTTLVPNVSQTVTKIYTQQYVWSQGPGLIKLIDLVSRSKY